MGIDVDSLIKRIPTAEREKYLKELLVDRDIPDPNSPTGTRHITGLETQLVGLISDLRIQENYIASLEERRATVESEVLRAKLNEAIVESAIRTLNLESNVEAVAKEVERIRDKLDAINQAG